MFAVIKTVYKKPTGINKIFAQKPKCFLNKIKIDGAYYYELAVHYSSKNIKWKKVFNTVNLSDVPIIMPKTEHLKQDINIKPYRDSLFSSIIYANCAKKLFSNKSKVFIIDNSFDNTYVFYSLLQFFREINIYTTDQQKYTNLKSKAETELGVTPIFCDNLKNAPSADLVINLQNTECEPMNKNILGLGGYTFIHGDIRLPKNIVRLIPRNISPFLFAAALFELCGITKLKDCTVIKLKNNTTQDIVKVKV